MNKTILMIIAVVAGLAAMFLVQRHVDNLVGDTITVYKATQDIPAGTPVGANFAAITLPSGLFPDILDEAPNQDLLEYIQETPLRAAVSADDILLYRHFDVSVDPGVLPAIPAGKKAISISVDETSSVSYFIQPGDLVDVMGTFAEVSDAGSQSRQLEQLEEVRGSRSATRPILQAVEVLAVGRNYRPSDRQQLESYGTVTLLVTMEEAAKLIFAKDYYSVTMTLVLRSANDMDVSQDMPTIGVDTRNFDDIGNEPTLTVPGSGG